MSENRMAKLAEQQQTLERQLTKLREESPDDAEIGEIESLLSQIDGLLKADKPREKPTRTRPHAAVPSSTPDGVVLLAKIPKTERAEVWVTVKRWKERRTVDVRLYFIPEGSTEFKPSRKGVSFDASKLGELLSGLNLAQQYLPAMERPEGTR